MPQNLPLEPGIIAAIVGVFAVLVLASRVAFVRTLLSLGIWAVIATMLVLVVSDRGRFDPYLQKLTGALNLDDQRVEGDTLRVPMSPDGHFWVRARIDGVQRRMLVDSGATVTAVGARTASAAGLDARTGLTPILIRTANGTVAGQTATIEELRLGNIVARDLAAVISPAFGETDVIGMNFLSRLKSWRVEGRTLILEPHHPQAVLTD